MRRFEFGRNSICRAAWIAVLLGGLPGAVLALDSADDAATVGDAIENPPEVLFADDAEARSVAIERLKRKPHEAVAALLKALDGDDFDRRVKAGEALLAVAPRDAKTAQMLVRELEDTNYNVERQTYCWRALVRVGSIALPAATEKQDYGLCLALLDPADTAASAAVLEVLARDAPSDTDEIGDVREEEEQEVDPLWLSRDPRIDLLYAIGAQQSAAAIGKALDEKPRSNWLFDAAYRLSARGAASLVPGLVKQFGSTNFARRIQAAEALARIGRTAVPALVEATKDANRRPLALSALRQLDPEAADAVEPLRRLLDCDDVVKRTDISEFAIERDDLPPLRVSDLVLDALAAIGPAAAPAAKDILRRELAAKPASMEFAARWARAFGPKGSEFVPLLAHDLSAEATSERISAACAKLAVDEYYRDQPPSEIRRRASYEDYKYRQDLALAWSRVTPNDERLRERYFAMLREGNALVDEPGCRAWPNLKDLAPVALAAPEKYKPELLQMLDEHGESRRKALYVLTLMEPDSPATITRGVAALESGDADERYMVFTALAECGGYSPELIAALAKFAATPADQRDPNSESDKAFALRAIRNHGRAIEAALPQLRELAATIGGDGELSSNQLEFLRVIAHAGPIDERIARKLARGLKHEEERERHATALALSMSAALPKATLPMLVDVIYADAEYLETPNSYVEQEIAKYARAIGRYGNAASGQQDLLLKLSLRQRTDQDLGSPVEWFDREDAPREGWCIASGRHAVESLVALGRIGPHVRPETLATLRDAFRYTAFDRDFEAASQLAAAIAILRIDGRKTAEDVAAVIEALRLASPEDISPSLAEELAALGTRQKEVLPRLRVLLSVARGRFMSSRPDDSPFSSRDVYIERGERLVDLAQCVAAIAPGDESTRALLRDALAWELAQFAYEAEPRASFLDMLVELDDRSSEFHKLAGQAAARAHWPAVRHAANQALRRAGER